MTLQEFLNLSPAEQTAWSNNPEHQAQLQIIQAQIEQLENAGIEIAVLENNQIALLSQSPNSVAKISPEVRDRLNTVQPLTLKSK
ncbi:hypothetical protein ACQ4M3_39770 [Leptolyngbya sp. AN03gr2]|uniref:hypothetical protein n=1 Tax=unclassified Leptolyngbya TaxID=2650499 RepID=UPI003D32226A